MNDEKSSLFPVCPFHVIKNNTTSTDSPHHLFMYDVKSNSFDESFQNGFPELCTELEYVTIGSPTPDTLINVPDDGG